ncbi:T9SS type A sorting domain-containing protein [Flavobacterium sp. GCM10023249]|uniref:T9SS type A sorting domain-containing protein n=1 Tax=unclassified Flavobacterium TaxID=196869 RepID=UPI003615F691
MKKIMFTKALLLLWGFVNAQCLINNGSLNSSIVGDGFNTSNPTVPNWLASHGDPTALGTVGGNTWAWMWSHSNRGEGIMTNYNFQSGQNYVMSFRVRATTNIGNPNTTVLNSTLNVKITSGLTSGSTYTMPTPSNVQTIWSSTVAAVGPNWQTITVPFTANSNQSQLWLHPLMTANSGSNGNAQIQMEVDDVAISPAINPSMYFQNAAGTMKTDFCLGESVYMNGTNSTNETHYYIDISRRPIGSTAAFQWQAQLGTNGWTTGQVGVLNLSNLFAAQNYFFADGFEYQVKLAVASACIPWVEMTRIFRIYTNSVSPAFTFTSTCAPNGTIRVTATASNTAPGISQWWALMETTTPGATSDAATIGQVGTVLMGNTVTFSGLSHTKNYYIKHGVFGNCVNWTEQRTALPQTAMWANYTTNFNMAPSANLNGTVTVTAAAHSNPLLVNHHWSIFEAPNGSTTGNTNVSGNPDQCCSNASATFSANLVVNHWYYIKHGIWNDCIPWNETRKAFRVVVQGLLADGSPDYAIEEYMIEEKTKESRTSASATTEDIVLYPNPVAAGATLQLTVGERKVADAQLVDFLGNTHKLAIGKNATQLISIPLNAQYKPGIYTLRVRCADGAVITKKVVIE